MSTWELKQRVLRSFPHFAEARKGRALTTPTPTQGRGGREGRGEALRFAGLRVSSVFDLVNARSKYPAAVPVLLRLLPKLKNHIVREGAVRALTVKEARGVAVTRSFGNSRRFPLRVTTVMRSSS